MKELSTEPTMTVKEVSNVLNVSERVIQSAVKKMYPDIVKNGKTTYLSEYQVTRVKQELSNHHNLEGTFEVTTELEMSEMTTKVIAYHIEKVKMLQSKNKELQNTVNILIHDSKTYTSTEIAKELNLKSASQLNKILESEGVQYKVNNSWVLSAKYSDMDYVSLKQQELDNGKIIYNRHWTGRGREFILKLMEEII